ncbi:hypothetical protein DICVIV_03008 [Dictyocaulus viviparus]|uniref:Uncharacterized protein n=1 Tax=Dictyocaulus viviparus TaxID=29172 RepID=A0A0D8Y1Y0_DICVI|nr:hypothetical protein DICVIV_03008 [Dictyocaulus viviparus]
MAGVPTTSAAQWKNRILDSSGVHALSSAQECVCGTPQIYNVVVLLRLTPLDITEAKDAMMLWMFDQVSRTLHDRASQVEGENLYNLFMVERYLPSDEFIEAVDGLTVVQKTHIGELSIGGRNLELDQIINGVILSLPDEVQVKARNFMMLMNTLVCLHSSLQEPPYY